MSSKHPYKLNPAHGADAEYWVARHKSRIPRLEQALAENTRGKKRATALKTEITNREAHLAELGEV